MKPKRGIFGIPLPDRMTLTSSDSIINSAYGDADADVSSADDKRVYAYEYMDVDECLPAL